MKMWLSKDVFPVDHNYRTVRCKRVGWCSQLCLTLGVHLWARKENDRYEALWLLFPWHHRITPTPFVFEWWVFLLGLGNWILDPQIVVLSTLFAWCLQLKMWCLPFFLLQHFAAASIDSPSKIVSTLSLKLPLVVECQNKKLTLVIMGYNQRKVILNVRHSISPSVQSPIAWMSPVVLGKNVKFKKFKNSKSRFYKNHSRL